MNSAAGGPLTGPSSLTLNGDGAGYLKVADLPERPISWKQEGDRVIPETRHVGAANRPSETDGTGTGPWVGRLLENRSTMVIDMEQVKVTLNQQAGR